MINPRKKLSVDEFDPERATADEGASVPPLTSGSVSITFVPVLEGDNVVPVSPCDIPTEETVVGVVDVVTVARPDGANVPPEPAAREGLGVPPSVAPADANVVGDVVPVDASEDDTNVGSNVAPAIGEDDVVTVARPDGANVPPEPAAREGLGVPPSVAPADANVVGDVVPADASEDDTNVGSNVAPAIGEEGDGAGEEPSSRGYVLFKISTTIASVAITRPSLSSMPSLPFMTSSAVTPQSEL
jgi:hypothetical protein